MFRLYIYIVVLLLNIEFLPNNYFGLLTSKLFFSFSRLFATYEQLCLQSSVNFTSRRYLPRANNNDNPQKDNINVQKDLKTTKRQDGGGRGGFS